MTPRYDLLTQPWIPVVDRNGNPDAVGLTDTLLRAHQLREIRDPVPILEFGVYRLLIALLADIFQFRSLQQLSDLVERRSDGLPPEPIRHYVEQCGQRFDLFDPKRPFLQSADLAAAERKPVALLHPGVPTGTNAVHFHHVEEFDFAVCPALAARLLTTIPAFMTMGGAGLSPSINGAPPWYVLIRRETLLETLVLNCCVLDLPHARTLGTPAWRRDPAKPTTGEVGLLEALTWQPRRLLLFPEEGEHCSLTGEPSGVVVRRMAFVAGAKADFDWWDDPNVAYRHAKEGVFPLRPREGREVWRDLGALAMARAPQGSPRTGDGFFERPRVVEQYARLIAGPFSDHEEEFDGEFELQVYGMRTDLKTKVFEWQTERLGLPRRLVWGQFLHDRAQRALAQAEEVGALLRYALRRAYPRDAKGNRSAFDTIIVAAAGEYWRRLRPHYEAFLDGLSALAGNATEETLLPLQEQWELAVRTTGREVLDRATEDLDADRSAIERLVKARGYFRASAYLVFHPEARKKRASTTAQAGASVPAGS
jgi:CRISPR system Cascade subunit CasA